MNLIIKIVTGFLAGTLASMGIGGSGLLIICLMLFLKVQQSKAAAIGLIFFIPVASLAVFLHSRKGLIKWKEAVPCAILGLIGALIGFLIANYVNQALLTKIFGGLLILMGLLQLKSEKKLIKN